jgi:hypothetical protein
MKIQGQKTAFAAVVLVGLFVAWTCAMPGQVSGRHLAGQTDVGCPCNWTTGVTCPTSKDAGTGNSCSHVANECGGAGSGACEADGKGCTDITFCDEVDQQKCTH